MRNKKSNKQKQTQKSESNEEFQERERISNEKTAEAS